MSIILDGPDGDLISRADLIIKWNNTPEAERSNFIDTIMSAPTACRLDIMDIEIREAAGHSFSIHEKDAHIILEKRGIVIEHKDILDKLLGEDSIKYASK